MIIKFKKLDPRACLPMKSTAGSSGFDLFALFSTNVPYLRLDPGNSFIFNTGISLEIPPGWEGQVRSRSGLAAKHGLFVLNSPGTIDSDYRGEIKVILTNLSGKAYDIRNLEKIAQLVFQEVPNVQLVEVENLNATQRGEGGFGSTGK